DIGGEHPAQCLLERQLDRFSARQQRRDSLLMRLDGAQFGQWYAVFVPRWVSMHGSHLAQPGAAPPGGPREFLDTAVGAGGVAATVPYRGAMTVPYGRDMEPVQPAAESAGERPARPGVGPLDEVTVRPLRTLITAKLVAMVILAGAVIASGFLLARQVGTGLGLAPKVAATVTSIEPLPADDNAVDSTCTRERVHVSWGDGRDGSFLTCGVTAADPD